MAGGGRAAAIVARTPGQDPAVCPPRLHPAPPKVPTGGAGLSRQETANTSRFLKEGLKRLKLLVPCLKEDLSSRCYPELRCLCPLPQLKWGGAGLAGRPGQTRPGSQAPALTQHSLLHKERFLKSSYRREIDFTQDVPWRVSWRRFSGQPLE